jgi:hypothetical protein
MNRQNNYWGFRGVKGQMFFNQLVNAVGDLSGTDGQLKNELDDQLRTAMRDPGSEENAARSLRNFRDYVTRIGQQFIGGGGEPRSKPNPGSVPFFVSYFWQIQRPHVWPVYYTNTVRMIESMNLWQASEDVAGDYLTFKRLHEELLELFSIKAERKFTLYDVEHVFWFKGGENAQPMDENVRDQITREDILEAIAALDRGEPHTFGPSTFYDLLEGGRRYPPKAVVGLAARRALGRPLRPDEFSGGQESWAFRLLRELGFTIVDKERRSSGGYEFPSVPPPRVWIEDTKTAVHGHGGPGWEFGLCLWSPSAYEGGSDHYALMREPKIDDLVIHINDGDLVGWSYVSRPFRELTAAITWPMGRATIILSRRPQGLSRIPTINPVGGVH